jgi:hypothetical protein
MNQVHEQILKTLKDKGYSQVRRVVAERGFDAEGSPALFVWVLVEDKTNDDSLRWAKVKPMIDAARSASQDSVDSDVWPYVRVRRNKEFFEIQAA